MNNDDVGFDVDVDYEIVQILLRIAIMAANCGLNQNALGIVKALHVYVGAASPEFSIIEALMLQRSGFSEDAVKLLTDINEEFPDHEKAKVFLAVIMKETGSPSWKTMAEMVANFGTDNDAIAIASELLDITESTTDLIK